VILPYTRLEAGWYGNEKYLSLSSDALRLWVLALNWSVSTGTDGVIPGAVKQRRTPARAMFIAFMGGDERALNKAIAELESATRWEPREGGGWDIHDFHKSQLSKEEVEQMREDNDRERAAARERMRRRRSTSNGSDGAVENSPDPVEGVVEIPEESGPAPPRDGPMFARTVRPNSSPDRTEGHEGHEDPDPVSGLTAALSRSRLRLPRAAAEEPIQEQDFDLPEPLAEILTSDQAYLLTKIGRSQPGFGAIKPTQIERHRAARGDGFVTELLRVLDSSMPAELTAPAAYFDSIAERIGPDWDAYVARKATKNGSVESETFPESNADQRSETVAAAAAGSEA